MEEPRSSFSNEREFSFDRKDAWPESDDQANVQEQQSDQSRSGNRNARRDPRARYALTLQRACNTALQKIKHDNAIINGKWAHPLAMAPSAISVMAVLFKAANCKAAAGLEIESQVIALADGEQKGVLPSKYFHTNLQHCSDIGRLAFRDAQHGMSDIQRTARSMLSEEGSIAYIIDLLEDPEDARYNLKPEIESVKKKAHGCLEKAEKITAKFDYWALVIDHLKRTSLSGIGQVEVAKRDVKTRKSDATEEEKQHNAERETLEAEIKELEKKLVGAKRDIQRAKDEVDMLRYEPTIAEPAFLDEMNQVKKQIPMHAPSKKAHEAEDNATRETHFKAVQKQRDDTLARAKEQRDFQRKLAADRLAKAREMEESLAVALDAARRELSERKYKLNEAKANIARTRAEMELLKDKESELDSVLEILDNSARDLGQLKDELAPLVDFFMDMNREVETAMKGNLDDFLRPIERGLRENATNPEEVEAIELRKASKAQIMKIALQTQGRLSAIADISGAYVNLSVKYIRPAIQKMEQLSTMKDPEWTIASRDFFQWCDDATMEIDAITHETCENIEKNMSKHMNSLRCRAIEAAEDNDE